MPSVAPSTVRTAAPSILLAASLTCLPLAGCGNRGELYLPSEAELEPEGLSAERVETAPPQGSLPGADAERRVITPSDTVNAITPPVPADEEEEEEEGAENERTREEAKGTSGVDRGDGR